jgi:hypothetical protein
MTCDLKSASNLCKMATVSLFLKKLSVITIFWFIILCLCLVLWVSLAICGNTDCNPCGKTSQQRQLNAESKKKKLGKYFDIVYHSV